MFQDPIKDAKLRRLYAMQMHTQYHTEHSLATTIIASRTQCLVSGSEQYAFTYIYFLSYFIQAMAPGTGFSDHLPLVDHLNMLSLYERSLAAVNETNAMLQNMIISGSPKSDVSLGCKSGGGKDRQGRVGEVANMTGLEGEKVLL